MSILSDAIAAQEQEVESPDWKFAPRSGYSPTASKTIPHFSPPFEWSRDYRFTGERFYNKGNRNYYQEPSQDDIAYACACINAERSRNWKIWCGRDVEFCGNTIKEYRDPRITTRYMPSETESQLCDCPYWGTEFS